VIQFDHVSKQYGNGPTVVDDVSITIPSHTVTALVGTSGSGKTTLLRMVNRMVDPSAGRVLIDDDDVATLQPVHLRRRIGYVMQESGLLPHRTVLANIMTVPRLNGASKPEASARALDLMDAVELDRDLASRYPAQLSGGQRQRVGVARALASDPNILLMDEPFSAVDPIVRAGLQELVQDLQSRLRKTILFVTHDISEAFTLADQVVLLSTGGIVEQIGTPHDLVARPASDFVARFISRGGNSSLHVESTGGAPIVLDGTGRVVGRLEEPRPGEGHREQTPPEEPGPAQPRVEEPR